MVVIFPLLLFVLLCAGAIDRSATLAGGCRWWSGSFIVQTNISTLVLVVVVLAATLVTVALTAVGDRARSPRSVGVPDVGRPAVEPDHLGVGGRRVGGTGVAVAPARSSSS